MNKGTQMLSKTVHKSWADLSARARAALSGSKLPQEERLLRKVHRLRKKLTRAESALGGLAGGQLPRDEAQAHEPHAGEQAARAVILDSYVSGAPTPGRAFEIFAGEWSSEIPGYGMGSIPLFDDSRITWFIEQCGGIEGKRVLELGPLEGGHTYMMARAGATHITSIEANIRAFLKCLIVQNALKFEADFLLGDFAAYLVDCPEVYDLAVASGVLYHMNKPVDLLRDLARISDNIGIWTHYYDPDVILANELLKRKFDPEPQVEQLGTRQIISHRQHYLEALQWSGFCGGSAPTSYWLTRDSLLGALTELGFTVTVRADDKDHQNGPAITLFARR